MSDDVVVSDDVVEEAEGLFSFAFRFSVSSSIIYGKIHYEHNDDV